MGLMNLLLGDYSKREVKKIEPIKNKVLNLEKEYSKLTDKELQAKTPEFKARLEKGETLDDILPEAFAACREASWRVLGMKHFPVQIIGGIILHQGRIAEMKTGEGKAVPVDTKIPTPDGWKTAGDIKLGDLLFDKNGNPTRVVGVYPQGMQETYEVTLRDGRKVKCNAEHLWQIFDNHRHNAPSYTTTTKEMFDIGAVAKRGYNFSLPTAEAVEYETKDLELDPYVLGCFLGNGCKDSHKNLVISSNDVELVHEVGKLLGASECIKPHSNNFTWHFSCGNYESGQHLDKRMLMKSDIYSDKLSTLLSDTYSYQKYIPEEYKLGSIEQRWSLLQGLMDTDGNIYKDKGNRYNIQFSTSSPQLRDDIMEIAYSLGCSCSYRMSRAAGVRNAKHDQYTIKFNVPNELKYKFFRLERKKKIALEAMNFHKKKRYDRISIVDIKKTEEICEQVCFAVDNDEHLFLVGDYVVTHNTMVETLPAYLNALTGNGVHIVTVNDYLARRDSELMGKVYRFMGLSVGLVVQGLTKKQRKEAYNADITYGTNNEFGFDYLRDNMVTEKSGKVQRGHNFTIVDEVDSILIDEARTPLIISGGGDPCSDLYSRANNFARTLSMTKVKETEDRIEIEENIDEIADIIVDEKARIATLTESGIKKAEKYFKIENLADEKNSAIAHHINQAIKAIGVMQRDIDYVVDDGEVLIVDEFTGRIMQGRRYNDGLHQAIEAKEGVKIERDNKTLASITFQNYFRMYKKLSGMTGTAKTESQEFNEIYSLDVVEIPTNKPIQRKDIPDTIFKTEEDKFNAIVEQIKECHAVGQPVLVGTVSIEKSEALSNVLKKHGIKHEVLNAKVHDKEAEIIAQAGKLGAVTISTNMAGRGTDILLGGNAEYLAKAEMRKLGYSDELISEATGFADTDNSEILEARTKFQELEKNFKTKIKSESDKVKECGGLYVIGTERHDSRRVDNQLRGRAGRQGDPGISHFYLSLEDDLMRLFGGERLSSMMDSLPQGTPIESKIVSKSIETAQKNKEAQHFAIRKNTVQFDDVLTRQRALIYEQRDRVLNGEELKPLIVKMLEDCVIDAFNLYCPTNIPESEWNVAGLRQKFKGWLIFNTDFPEDKISNREEAILDLIERGELIYNKREEVLGPEIMRMMERMILLKSVDHYWEEHIDAMESLKNGIGLRSYGQQDPVVAYRLESSDMFDEMNILIRENTVKRILTIVLQSEVEAVKKL